MSGYNVRALLTGDVPQNLAAFLTGSEGTLAVAKSIELKLTRFQGIRSTKATHSVSCLLEQSNNKRRNKVLQAEMTTSRRRSSFGRCCTTPWCERPPSPDQARSDMAE